MTPALAATLAAAMILTGIFIGVLGFLPAPESNSKPLLAKRRRKLNRTTLVKVGIAAGLGFIAALLTGWVILILVLPALVLVVPYLFDQSDKDEVRRLDGLDEWSRALAGVLGAGISLEQAIVATQSSAPDELKTEITTLIARIRSRMSLEEALRRFAADVNDSTCDKIVCTLLLVKKRGDGGLVRILEDLAESVGEDVSARRMVQAERAKQSAVMRYVTLITVVVFGGFLMFGGTYIAPYGTPLGQMILAVLLAIYVGLLVWLRQMNHSKPLPRLLTYVDAERTLT